LHPGRFFPLGSDPDFRQGSVIEGTVRNQAGEACQAGVTLAPADPSTGDEIGVDTDEAGRFRFFGLERGSPYSLSGGDHALVGMRVLSASRDRVLIELTVSDLGEALGIDQRVVRIAP
jgi:hypothetical protein